MFLILLRTAQKEYVKPERSYNIGEVVPQRERRLHVEKNQHEPEGSRIGPFYPSGKFFKDLSMMTLLSKRI